jgi:hypothetical protein
MSRRSKVCQKAVASVVEQLEGRTLLTTLVGGGVDPGTGDPIALQYTYLDAHDNVCVISVGGNTTVEAIAARVSMADKFVLGDLVNGPLGEGRDLFQLYVSESDSRSFVTVARRLPGIPIAPFTGDAGPFRIFDANTGQLVVVTPDAGTGGIILGARTKAAPLQDRPLISKTFAGAFGVRPASPNGRINAGLEVAPGLDFGKFHFGGVVTGLVTVPGSMESFYAGNLWTGDATGLPVGGTVSRHRTPNFTIGGSLNSLLVGGSIGTDNDAALDQPVYTTGFDMLVGGVLGQVAARDSIIGAVDAQHQVGLKGAYGSNIGEAEGRGIRNSNVGWNGGQLTGSGLVSDDSFDQAQILPSFPGKRGRSTVVVNGELNASPLPTAQDYVDYYGMPMLAGQSLTVQLSPTGTIAGQNLMNVGVFDPDGRLIATDYPNVDRTSVIGAPLHFTADRPGLYRIAVAGTGNGDFTVGGEFGELNIGLSPYTLVINGGGDLGFGGVIAGNNIWEGRLTGYGFQVEQGDFGALEAGGNIFSTTDQSVSVRRGSLRSIDGGSVGVLRGTTLGDSPNLFVTRGHVGLVRSRIGILALNEGVLPLSVGGNYQVVSAATTLVANLITNYSIGVIRAGDMATLTPSVFTANADLLNDDGVIDLIDVAGDMGANGPGGPAITTGPGGNVRYMNVGGQVFRDAFFGHTAGPEATTHPAGESVRINDDSGAKIDLVPFPLVPNPLFVPGGTNPAQIGPALTVTAYPIRGSGGVALINVTSTGSVRVGAGGAQGTQSRAEIGLIQTTGAGNPVIRSTNDGSLVFAQPTTGTGAVNLDVLVDGSARVDVFKIQGGNFTSIKNSTPGEILNIDAATIGSLQAMTIGTGISRTTAMVNPIQVISNAFPFNQQHNGVVSGNVANIEASGPVGNLNINGSIGNLQANSGGHHTTGGFEGINGAVAVTGAMATVDIGDGILPSGTGNLAKAGLFVGGILGTVRNRGLGSDIRGDIVSSTQINEILVKDGAIVGNKILVASPFATSRRFDGRGFLPETVADDSTHPFFEIGKIAVSGRGGILGSEISSSDIGPVTVHGGFGIVNSTFQSVGDGTFAKIEAEGYGMRGVEVTGGAFLKNFSASAGRTRNVSVEEFTPSVLQSDRYTIDPFFDQAPSRETDLHVYLGTSANKPKVKGVTQTGVIADTNIAISRTVSTVFANQIRTSSIHSGNSVENVQTREAVDALEITTGRLRKYLSGAGSSGLDFNVSGIIDSFHSCGVVDNTSRIRALGSSGHIYDFIVDGSLDGDVSSTNELRFLAVGKDLGASSLVKVKSLTKEQIKGSIFGTIQIG